MLRSSSPRVFAALFPQQAGVFYLAFFAQDGTPIMGYFVPTRSEARYDISMGVHVPDCHRHYPDGFKLVDLTKYTIDELLNIGDFLSAVRLENFAAPKR